MKNTINNVIVSFRRLSLEYDRLFGTSLQIEERDVTPFEILKKVCYLSIPDEKLIGQNAQDEIETILWSEFVMSEDETLEFVRIYGYRDDKSSKTKDFSNFMAWCLFQYTFMIAKEEKQKKNEFLWVSILFPYIYKLNTYNVGRNNGNKLCKKLLQDLLDKYPLGSGQKKSLDIFKEFNKKIVKDESYLSKVLNMKERFGIEMKEAVINDAIVACKQGIAVAVHMSGRR